MSESLSQEQREEDFREFHAEHLRRQTSAIESIRGIMMAWVIVTIIGAVFVAYASTR